MARPPLAVLIGVGLLAVSACTSATAGDDAARGQTSPTEASSTTTGVTEVSSAAPPATDAASTTAPPTTTPTTPPAESTTTTTPATTAPPDSTTTTTTTPPSTTTPRPPRRPCVVRVRPGDSLSSIADAVDDQKVTVESIQRENGILDPDRINAGDQLDVCVGNKIDDITGKKRVPPRIPPLGPNSRGVMAQQQKLNQLFAGYGLPELAVDGDSGPITEQALCAARLALGLPVSRGDMAPGSPEERALMRAESVSVPPGAAVDYGHWVLIDQTCQILFAGEGGGLVFVFPTSTGEAGYETRNQTASPVFRYDPATENGGWHNSTHYPVPADNPLNGNMYKPLYFDNGQAIHGANNVPTSPASKGCARLPVYSQDALIDWLGLSDVTSPIWDDIGLVVTVQGAY